jgi:HPt (histidine-containing phosphotransfer) domain-containing protein
LPIGISVPADLWDVGTECYDAGMSGSLPKSGVAKSEPGTLLIDRLCVDEIRRIEQATGRNDVFSGFVRTLEGHLAGFGAAFSDYIARGDTRGAERAAHTLKGTCRQLGAQALGDLFADIESSAKAGDYAEAKRRFDSGASLIAQSLEALKQA